MRGHNGFSATSKEPVTYPLRFVLLETCDFTDGAFSLPKEISERLPSFPPTILIVKLQTCDRPYMIVLL